MKVATKLHKRSRLRAVFLIMASPFLTGVMTAAGPQTSSQPSRATNSRAVQALLPTVLPMGLANYQAKLGDRLVTPGKESILLSGELTSGEATAANGDKSVAVTWQLPGKFNLTQGGAQAIRFDGGSAKLAAGQRSSEAGLTESLVLDLPESLFLAAASGVPVEFLGAAFTRTDASLPKVDYYRFFGTDGTAGGFAGLYTTTRIAAFDTVTGLLAEVVHPAENGAAPNRTVFSNWQTINGQSFPGTITRYEGGSQVFVFKVGRSSAGALQPDSVFAETGAQE